MTTTLKNFGYGLKFYRVVILHVERIGLSSFEFYHAKRGWVKVRNMDVNSKLWRYFAFNA